MSWCQHSHVRIKNKVIQETYIRHGCFEVITFYWLQSENVVWLANLTLGFEITLLPLCSNQWEPFSHELLLICIPQSNINSFPEVFQFHYRYFFFLKSLLLEGLLIHLLVLGYFPTPSWWQPRISIGVLHQAGKKVPVWPKLFYEQLNYTMNNLISTIRLAF